MDVLSIIEFFLDHNEEIVNSHLEALRSKRNKPTFIQKLLSINDFVQKNQLEFNGPDLNII